MFKNFKAYIAEQQEGPGKEETLTINFKETLIDQGE